MVAHDDVPEDESAPAESRQPLIQVRLSPETTRVTVPEELPLFSLAELRRGYELLGIADDPVIMEHLEDLSRRDLADPCIVWAEDTALTAALASDEARERVRRYLRISVEEMIERLRRLG